MNHVADTSRRCQWLSRGTTPPRRRCWTVEPRDATRSTKTPGDDDEEEQPQRRTPSTSPTQAGTTNAKGRNTGTTGSITGLASATLSGHISHAVSLVLSADDARSWGWVIRSLEGGDSCVSNIPLGSGYIGLDGGKSEKKSTFVRCHLHRRRTGGARSDVVVSGGRTNQHTLTTHTHTHARTRNTVVGAHTSGSRVSRCLTRALGGACESGPPPICRLSRGVAVVSRGVESRATRAEMHERGGGAAVVRKREGHARRVRAKQAAAAGRPDAHAAPSALRRQTLSGLRTPRSFLLRMSEDAERRTW